MSQVLIGMGLVLMFFGIWGTIILPDLFLRLHASTKCGVTGSVTILIGLALEAGWGPLAIRLLLIVIFLFWTTPLIPHIMGLSYLQRKTDSGEDG